MVLWVGELGNWELGREIGGEGGEGSTILTEGTDVQTWNVG